MVVDLWKKIKPQKLICGKKLNPRCNANKIFSVWPFICRIIDQVEKVAENLEKPLDLLEYDSNGFRKVPWRWFISLNSMKIPLDGWVYWDRKSKNQTSVLLGIQIDLILYRADISFNSSVFNFLSSLDFASEM